MNSLKIRHTDKISYTSKDWIIKNIYKYDFRYEIYKMWDSFYESAKILSNNSKKQDWCDWYIYYVFIYLSLHSLELFLKYIYLTIHGIWDNETEYVFSVIESDMWRKYWHDLCKIQEDIESIIWKIFDNESDESIFKELSHIYKTKEFEYWTKFYWNQSDIIESIKNTKLCFPNFPFFWKDENDLSWYKHIQHYWKETDLLNIIEIVYKNITSFKKIEESRKFKS